MPAADCPTADLEQAPPKITRPELLAPAGDRDCIRAAIENGADAVYFGLETGFNARARATNFAVEDLPEIMGDLHHRGLKGYVTLNTLVFPSELPAIESLVRKIAAAGVDAVLVQDLGLARLVRATCPDLPMHASTQMTMTSAENLRLVEELGIERVVLARELSIDEIVKIRAETTLPLEVFVHGALCVAYSGQCLTSESLGGRSANRGQCAQACRMPYELVCDGNPVDLGEQQYLLSPQDLAAFDLVPQLIAAGVSSLKIEGRLKTPEYVANITRHYREAIDTALAGQQVAFSKRQVEEMELSFSRGFSHGWLDGCDHKMLVPALSSAKHGVLLGQITGISRQRVEIELSSSIKAGDGIVFDGDRYETERRAGAGSASAEQGGRVYEVFERGRLLAEVAESGRVELAFAHGSIDFGRLKIGQKIWKTDDPQLNSQLRKSFAGGQSGRRTDVDLHVTAVVGEPLRIEAHTSTGAGCTVISPDPLVAAMKHPLTAESLAENLGRLGTTAYRLRDLQAEINGAPMIPLSVLGKLRHQLVAALDEASSRAPERKIAEQPTLNILRADVAAAKAANQKNATGVPRIHVLCRSLRQLGQVLACGVRSVYVDFQDIREFAQAVPLARAEGATIYIATPRIQKPDEMGVFRVIARHEADGMLVRNLAGLDFCRARRIPTIADFSLNVTNELTAQLLLKEGAQRATASYDLNREQLLDLVAAVPPAWLEVVVHQHMPMFHMEHCVFCAVLSPGTNKHNCGRPCDTHQVELRDRIGLAHPLKADVGCRNTLFNAVPQSAAEAVPQLVGRGLRDFRIELLDDASDADTRRIIDLYSELLAGRVTGQHVWKTLQAANRVGVTRGTLEERRNPLAIL